MRAFAASSYYCMALTGAAPRPPPRPSVPSARRSLALAHALSAHSNVAHPPPPPPAIFLCHAVAFTQGTPFRPFEQLLAVLPSASARLLPLPYRSLMLNPASPVIDFYPPTFEVGRGAGGRGA